MEEFGSIDEVLDFAIDREIEANQFYLDLASRIPNVAMRKVFEDFASHLLNSYIPIEV